MVKTTCIDTISYDFGGNGGRALEFSLVWVELLGVVITGGSLMLCNEVLVGRPAFDSDDVGKTGEDTIL